MSKFKAGDKVVVKSAGRKSYWYSDQIGKQFTLLEKDGYNDWSIEETECGGVLAEEDIELVVPSFDLHNNPWYIRVENEEQFDLANEWLRENFGDSLVSRWEHLKDVVGITNTDSFAELSEYLMWIQEEHLNGDVFRHEIKLNFKTTISSIEYPVVETEQQKRIRELKETIDSASKQLEELMKETK